MSNTLIALLVATVLIGCAVATRKTSPTLSGILTFLGLVAIFTIGQGIDQP